MYGTSMYFYKDSKRRQKEAEEITDTLSHLVLT